MLNLNTPNKQWNMYLNTLSSISGDDLTIKPDTRRNLLLEVSGNNNIFIKRGDVSYNLSNLIRGDVSFSNVDVSNNLNPLTNNNGSLGTTNKLWNNAYIRDISATNISISGNMTISGTISNVIQIIPRLDISSSLGNNTNIWQRAFINDLSGISRINGSTWPLSGPTGPTGPTGAIGVSGVSGPTGVSGALGVSINATLTDISNFRITTKNRIYQEISGGINDLSWTSVNGYYGLAKDAYPSLNPLSSGDLAVSRWSARQAPQSTWHSVCWSPLHAIFVAVGLGVIMTSPDGITWTSRTVPQANDWLNVCWSPELKLFVAVSNGGFRVMTSLNGIDWQGKTAIGADWWGICWSSELGIFVAVAESGSNVMTSTDGSNWDSRPAIAAGWRNVCWSPQLRLFVAVGLGGVIMTSPDGISWTGRTSIVRDWWGICWSSELGIFVVVGDRANVVMTSSDGITWTSRTAITGRWFQVCWSSQLRLFVAVGFQNDNVMISQDGIKWTLKLAIESSGWWGICWSPELGIFVAVASYLGTNRVMTSSLKGRPPTSYNLFDSSFNRIDENGKWDFSNINVKVLTAGGASVSSDDRLKHNEVNINNGLDIIDKLTPKFYKKTQVLLDASYNGDLSGYAWTLEAGLIAQELLQISDLSFTVGGGDYYEQTYKLITQTNDLSNSYYDLSTNYEVSNNLIAQAYNVNYNSIFVYGVAAIKELHTKVKTQETSILDEQLNDLVLRIEALESNNNV